MSEPWISELSRMTLEGECAECGGTEPESETCEDHCLYEPMPEDCQATESFAINSARQFLALPMVEQLQSVVDEWESAHPDAPAAERDNARLMAAAPELLAVLRSAYALMPTGTRKRGAWIEQAINVFRKVDGRQ